MQTSLYQHRSYRSFLKSVLQERILKNPAYSLRAMAGQLGFSSSQVSEALNGKANFSTESLRKIARKLELDDEQSDYLCKLGELESHKDPEARASVVEQIQKHLQRNNVQARAVYDLNVDYFKQIADWYHSAILELVYLKGFEFTPENIAQKLQISKLDAELAIERLLRLELLFRDQDGNIKRPKEKILVQSPEKNTAMRALYRQMFQKASDALENQDPQVRWSGYETLAVADEALPEIRKACDKFFDEVLRISAKYPQKKSVYHLLTHFFRLTTEKK